MELKPRASVVLAALALAATSCTKEPTPYERMQMETTAIQGQQLKQTAIERDQQLAALRSGMTEQSIEQRKVPADPDRRISEPVGLEMLWRVPDEPVTAYHFYYGIEPNNLTEHVRVPVDDIEKLVHPVYGAVYRYRIRRPLPESELFVSIRAENEHGLSPHSKELRVPVDHPVGVDPRGTSVPQHVEQ